MLRSVLVLLVVVFAASALTVPAAAQDAPDPPRDTTFAFPFPDVSPVNDRAIYSFALLEFLETAPMGSGVPARVEGLFWVGGDYTRFWFKAEGEGRVEEAASEIELQGLYSRLISPYFEAQAGLRLDTDLGDDVRARPHLVVGLEGLVPYWFEVEPALFLSAGGDLSARFTGSYDLLVTQRLVAQPLLELNAALQEVAEWGIGTGINDVEVGIRLRYEIKREVAPYVGVTWLRRVGAAADFARAGGEDAAETHLVFGIRLWR